MTLRHLKIFIAVAENKSITKAAHQLHLAQPSVTLAIQEIEQYYGIMLFDRIGKRLYITDSGNQFYDYASHIIALFDEMEKRFKDGDILKELRIGASVTIGNFYLPELINKYKKEHPEITIHAIIQNTENIEESLIHNSIDFALIEGGFVNDSRLKQIPFWEDQLLLVCGKTHELVERESISLHELAHYDFLLREKGSSTRESLEKLLGENHLTITPIWESVSTQALIRAVEAGLGISVIPSSLAKREIRKKRLHVIEIENCSLSRHFSILYHKNKYLSQSANDFIELCKNSAETISQEIY